MLTFINYQVKYNDKCYLCLFDSIFYNSKLCVSFEILTDLPKGLDYRYGIFELENSRSKPTQLHQLSHDNCYNQKSESIFWYKINLLKLPILNINLPTLPKLSNFYNKYFSNDYIYYHFYHSVDPYSRDPYSKLIEQAQTDVLSEIDFKDENVFENIVILSEFNFSDFWKIFWVNSSVYEKYNRELGIYDYVYDQGDVQGQGQAQDYETVDPLYHYDSYDQNLDAEYYSIESAYNDGYIYQHANTYTYPELPTRSVKHQNFKREADSYPNPSTEFKKYEIQKNSQKVYLERGFYVTIILISWLVILILFLVYACRFYQFWKIQLKYFKKILKINFGKLVENIRRSFIRTCRLIRRLSTTSTTTRSPSTSQSAILLSSNGRDDSLLIFNSNFTSHIKVLEQRPILLDKGVQCRPIFEGLKIEQSKNLSTHFLSKADEKVKPRATSATTNIKILKSYKDKRCGPDTPTTSPVPSKSSQSIQVSLAKVVPYEVHELKYRFGSYTSFESTDLTATNTNTFEDDKQEVSASVFSETPSLEADQVDPVSTTKVMVESGNEQPTRFLTKLPTIRVETPRSSDKSSGKSDSFLSKAKSRFYRFNKK